MDEVLVASTHDDFDIVVVTRLFAEPQIDGPPARDRPPHPDLADDFGDH